MEPESRPAALPHEKVKKELRTLLADMDLPITNEYDNETAWGFWIKFGNFPVFIENRKPLKYCIVALQFTFSEEDVIGTVNGFYKNQDHVFIYRLTRALTSPATSFSRIMEGGQVVGYTVMRSIYPFHAGFSIHDLDEAIQSVVSIGEIGVAFLKSEIGKAAVLRVPPPPASEPGHMFE